LVLIPAVIDKGHKIVVLMAILVGLVRPHSGAATQLDSIPNENQACSLAKETERSVAQAASENQVKSSVFLGSRQKVKKGETDSISGFHVWGRDGLHLAGPYGNLRFQINGSIMLDGGTIDPDDELQAAFPDLDGSDIDFRKLQADVKVKLYDVLEGKLGVDFANARDIKDNWIRFTRIPILEHIRLGHVKEPFSLEELTSLRNVTFMERALPALAFSPGRNIGIRYDAPSSDRRISWAVGGFLNTGSLADPGDAKDRISEANGFNLSARVVGLPWYEEEGRRLLHLGLSYLHGFRDEDDVDLLARISARPESRLTDEKLVDISFPVDRADMIGTELATVYGPLSFQGELFFLSTDADVEGGTDFWGYYLSVSYFITGEHRKYDRSGGVFSGVKPNHTFRPFRGGWGALELGFRLSYVDLNDGDIKGGREKDFTAGLNWYLFPKIRFMFNYVRAKLEERDTPSVDDGRADILQARFQMSF
jgi:phosphate-selective porin OprO/OprP